MSGFSASLKKYQHNFFFMYVKIILNSFYALYKSKQVYDDLVVIPVVLFAITIFRMGLHTLAPLRFLDILLSSLLYTFVVLFFFVYVKTL